MTGPNFTLFLVCTVIAIAGAVTTVVARRPLRAAMGLLSNIIALSGLYLTLSAHLLAAIQVLVYAGAVVVLFVFVIMLIGPASEGSPERRSNVGRTVSLAVMGMITAVVSFSVVGVAGEWVALSEGYGTVQGLGGDLYTKALVPFEMVSITLTVAIIGAMALAKTRTKAEVADAKAVRESILAQRAEEGAAAPAE